MRLLSSEEIEETNKMIEEQGLDVRTITIGINLLDTISSDIDKMKENILQKIISVTSNLSEVAQEIKEEYGIPIINRRITVTPVSLLMGSLKCIQEIPLEDIQAYNDPLYHRNNLNEIIISEDIHKCFLEIAQILDTASKKVKVDYLGGFTSLVHKGFTRADLGLIKCIPEVLSKTERVCASINVASTKSGMNMNAVRLLGQIIKDTAIKTAEKNSIGCAKLCSFVNSVEDNPFMAGGYHGIGEAESCINIGISGPGVVRSVVRHFKNVDFETLAENVKKTAFKITRVGQLVAQESAKRLGIPFGIVDLSLAPTTRPFDSVAGILEEMGIETTGGPGSTAALSLLTDAIKKGGVMASSYVGGLSGAFIPVAEDLNMNAAAEKGILSIEKLEAMTAVCSTGLDMICIPGDTSTTTISGIMADAFAIGMINNKTIGTRLIPVIGKNIGEKVEFGGLLGEAVIMPVSNSSCEVFINRKGRIPAPIHSFRN